LLHLWLYYLFNKATACVKLFRFALTVVDTQQIAADRQWTVGSEWWAMDIGQWEQTEDSKSGSGH
jgi:hypothetical protein